LESQEERTGFSTTLSTSKLGDESNICISNAESFNSHGNLMAIGHGKKINYDAKCISDDSDEDASFDNTMCYGRGRMLNNFNQRFRLNGRRN